MVGANSFQTWNYWERGHRPMPLAMWTVFLLATGQHSDYVLQRI
ncbi:hypothetical protein BLL52_4266 [Rhodoferax antarcticus ANT.BR]|uniref:Uncharacterized protein n=1 Tax=Rhodoferax antarcticus ANT.BR TaxID=1111071 RepID=A0A1Q8Y8Y1_9BURK|nr:hypothetical protein BLL52_4266 [Rhodoferax antarcticus ANT.BR]